ncbi:uncharacterized protein LOC116414758 [Apis florea]|uniref:uncharacterized protein LOC116414758 n=1 Tax=Apis florea TaxID=7463 RepID=UPI0012FEFEB9|nr:uncharacterized protein LOC116414758 [Apis florea]
MPNLKYLDLRVNNIPSDLFSFGNNSNLEILRLGYQSRQYYWYTNEQTRITNIFPELQLLDLEYANINRLETNNQINYLHDDTFEQITNLRYLNLLFQLEYP